VLIFFGSGFREILYLVSLGVELLDLPTSQKHLTAKIVMSRRNLTFDEQDAIF
jgi:hypothetical protein